MKLGLLFLFSFILAGYFSANFVSAAEKININTAPLEDLIKIIHIGEVRALELISLRPFSSLNELTKIKGVGEARLEDIKNQGLAWVEPNSTESSLMSLIPETTPSPDVQSQQPQKELTATSESFNLNLGSRFSRTSLYIFLAAVFTSFFGGVMILVLKKNSKLS